MKQHRPQSASAAPSTAQQASPTSAGAGNAANFTDADYIAAGAEVKTASDVYSADIVIKVRPPTDSEVGMLKDGNKLISQIFPSKNEELVKKLADKNMTVWGMDCMPRTISRGQAFDTLSSQANISGYKAVIEAAGCVFLRSYVVWEK